MFNSSFFASLPVDEPLIQSRTLTKRITAIQKQVEGRHFDMRKHVLEYDDVMNQHRLIVYGRRQKMLEDFAKQSSTNSDIDLLVDTVFAEEAHHFITRYQDENEHLQKDKIEEALADIMKKTVTLDGNNEEEIQKEIYTLWKEKLAETEKLFGDRNFDQFQREMYLSAIDQLWMEHIEKMADLREDVAFEGYNQRQPLLVYQERAYGYFMTMLDEVNYRVVRGLLSALATTQIVSQQINLDELATDQGKQESHPLFRQPQGGEEGIKVIRVK